MMECVCYFMDRIRSFLILPADYFDFNYSTYLFHYNEIYGALCVAYKFNLISVSFFAAMEDILDSAREDFYEMHGG